MCRSLIGGEAIPEPSNGRCWGKEMPFNDATSARQCFVEEKTFGFY